MTKVEETDLFHKAIRHWWVSKTVKKAKKAKKAKKVKKTKKAKRAQGGTRDANLHGKTMDEFARTIRDFLVERNVQPEHIFAGGHLAKTPSILPSYFRPSKNWDLIVVANSRFHPADGDCGDPVLFAAIEFKSQDKSIGNNQNNRLEESLGNALDFWTSYEHAGFVRLQPRPWLGYLFVGNYLPDSDGKPVNVRQPHFLAMPSYRTDGSDENETFAGPSYAERYKIFMRQALGSRLYDAGAFLVTDETISKQAINHRILVPEFGSASFLRSLKGQILAHYPNAKVKPGSVASKI